MNKIEIIKDSITISACYKKVEETNAWIAQCESELLWGEIGSYSIIITDASVELEEIRVKKELVSKQTLDPLIASAKNRANHTGSQTSNTISDFNEAAQDAVGNVLANSSDINFSYPDVNNQISASLSNSGVASGSYNLVTVDSKGRVVAGSNSDAVIKYYFKNSTNAVVSATAYANVGELVTSNLPIGLYRLSFVGRMQSGSTTSGIGIRIANNTATVSSIVVKWFISQATNGVSQNFQYDQIATSTNVSSASVQAANTNFSVYGEGLLRITALGSLAVQTRSELAGTSSTLLSDSILILELV